jgi:hypothetical protein
MTAGFDWHPLLSAGSPDAVLAALRGLSEPRRDVLSTALTAYVTTHDALAPTTLAAAAIGCLPSAAAAVDVLQGGRHHWRHAEPEPVVAVARERGIDWLGDVALALAGTMAVEFSGPGWRVVAELLRATGTPPPGDDAFVQGWLFDAVWSDHPVGLPVPDRLREDPFLDPLLPRLFEVDTVGEQLADRGRGGDGRGVLADAFAYLANTGRVDRIYILDRCLDRLLAGGAGRELRGFVRLHDRLAPVPAEVLARLVCYQRLLYDGLAAVATMAQRALRRAGAPPDVVLDASRIVLNRPYKPLVGKQIQWLDETAARHADRVAEVLDLLATVAAHPEPELRDLAREVAAKHLRADVR